MIARDVQACLLPNGQVLCCAGTASGGGGWGAPPEFFEYDPYTDVLHSVPTPPLNASVPFVGRMLLLPTGQVLYASDNSNINIGTPTRRQRRTEERIEARDHRGLPRSHPGEPAQGARSPVQRRVAGLQLR